MAIVEEYTATQAEQMAEPLGEGVEGKFTVQWPDTTDDEAVEQFTIMLHNNAEQLGVKTLLKSFTKMQRHYQLAHGFERSAHKSADRINGIRSKAERTGDTKRSLRATAKGFYESLNTASLRMQCTLFNLDYSAYETQEEVIAQLVEKHLEMQATA